MARDYPAESPVPARAPLRSGRWKPRLTSDASSAAVRRARRDQRPRDRRAAPGPAVRGPLRMRAQGPADGAERVRLPVARAARPYRHDRRRASSARPTGSGCASSAATRCALAARLERFSGELVGRARRRAPARARVVRPGRVPARRLSLGRGARGLSRAPVPRGPRPRPARRRRAARCSPSRWRASSAAPPAPAAGTTPTSAGCSSTRSRSGRWSASSASSIPGSTPTC